MTQIGIFVATIEAGTAFFGNVYFYAMWVFILTFIIGAIVTCVRRKSSSILLVVCFCLLLFAFVCFCLLLFAFVCFCLLCINVFRGYMDLSYLDIDENDESDEEDMRV
jgi:hypothetical protein